jgi:hypothetical protein
MRVIAPSRRAWIILAVPRIMLHRDRFPSPTANGVIHPSPYPDVIAATSSGHDSGVQTGYPGDARIATVADVPMNERHRAACRALVT